jgi:hypothetical protein
MLIHKHTGLMAAGAVALVLLFGLISTAQARTFSMTGKWVQRRGVAYIPVSPMSAGIPAKPGATVAQHQVNPPRLTVPTDAFTGSFSTAQVLPQPSLISLTTAFADAGPKSAGKFKKNFWVGNRTFKDFAYCPGFGGNPACPDPNAGTKHGLVRYTAGVNAYGGTMQMVSGGGGTLQRVFGVSPLLVGHLAFGGATGAAPTEAPGGAYGNTSLIDVLPTGPVTLSPVLSSGGLIQTPGPTVGTAPGTTIINRGFSWTTGMVYVKGTQGGPVSSTTITVTGSDSRSAWGVGNITLVAGGIGNRVGLSNYTFMDFDRVIMSLVPNEPVPAMSPSTLAAGAGLMLLAFGYAVRRFSK